MQRTVYRIVVTAFAAALATALGLACARPVERAAPTQAAAPSDRAAAARPASESSAAPEPPPAVERLQLASLPTAELPLAVEALAKERRRELEGALDASLGQLAVARDRFSGSPDQQRMIDMLAQLLEISRAQLRGETPAVGPTPEYEATVAAILTETQARLDRARERARGSDDPRRMEQVEEAQRRLDQARARLHGRSSTAAAGGGTEDLQALMDRTQRGLDQARLQAAGAPGAQALLRQLDEAQRQLDRARADAGVAAARGGAE